MTRTLSPSGCPNAPSVVAGRTTRLLLATLVMLGLGITPASAATLHVPGLTQVNELTLPVGVPESLGDVLFSADGSTLYLLGGAEAANSGVWSAPVIRDGLGTVVGFGDATVVFTHPSMDTGLEFEPGSGTLFFRVIGGHVGQWQADGSIATFRATGAASYGGLTFVPDSLPNAGDLLTGNWSAGSIDAHSLTDNLDGTFTPVRLGSYGMTESGAGADLHFVPTGQFAGDLLFTNWPAGEVSILEVDPATGYPAAGGSMTLLASGLGVGPWGLEFDPVTGNLFIANFIGTPRNGLTQITGFPPLVIDSDDDGVPDDEDACPGGDDSVDTDGDLVPDFCDSCPLHAEDDPDGDGVCGSAPTLACEGFMGRHSRHLYASILDADGLPMTDEHMAPPHAKVMFFPADGGSGVDVSMQVARRGFEFSKRRYWRAKLNRWKMRRAGTYVVTMELAGDSHQLEPTCSTSIEKKGMTKRRSWRKHSWWHRDADDGDDDD